MKHDIGFLWQSRERPSDLRRWWVVWLKRLYHLKGLAFLLVRPMLLRRRGAMIGRLVVLGRSTIQGGLQFLTIGDETALGRCEIALHDSISIGRRVVINDGVQLLTASHSLSDVSWPVRTAPIAIGDYAWIATNAMILPGVTIGRGATVGAGAVVREDVPDYAVVVGNPAMLSRQSRTHSLDYCPVLLAAPFEAWMGIPLSPGAKR
jgi:acetyltransferase-like isoleucine patch superfamily enzyme